MTFKYRVKAYKYEEGEYSEYQAADKNLILLIIHTQWTNESAPNAVQVISICNESGEHLLIEHFQKYVFDIYFLPKRTDLHFHKKSQIEVAYDAIDFFFDNKIDELESFLNKTKEDNSYIRGDFFYVDHNYRYTRERSISQRYWMLFGLPLGLVLSGIGISALFSPMGFFGLLFVAGGFYFWLPGVLLHRQYKMDIGDLTIRVTKGQDKIIATSDGTKREFQKRDIVKVTRYKNPAYKIPWSDYGYTQIEFKTGEIINLTSLIVDQTFILEKFSKNDTRLFKVDRMIPSIKMVTRIN